MTGVAARSQGSARGGAQRGAVLMLALLFTLLLGLVAAAGLESAALQLRMSVNDEVHTQLLGQAAEIAGRLAGVRAHFDLTGPAGQANCARGDTSPGCDLHDLPDSGTFDLAGESLPHYRVVRQDALLVAADRAAFEVQVRVDAGAGAPGSAELAVGVAVPLAGGDPEPLYWREPGIDPL